MSGDGLRTAGRRAHSAPEQFEGAMLEPVNTVLKAVRRLELLPGDSALVVGQGPIGLLFTRLLTWVA
jgi:threonine dehydrogenase-like Zn-dependent dehydrogenase